MRAEGKELRGQGTMRMTKMALDSSNKFTVENYLLKEFRVFNLKGR